MIIVGGRQLLLMAGIHINHYPEVKDVIHHNINNINENINHYKK